MNIQTDIQYWDDTLTEEIQVIQSQLDRLPSLGDGVEKAAAIDKLKKKIRGAKGTKRSFKMEIRLVQDVNQRRKYESRLASLDQQLQTLVADCKAIESENNRGELFVGGEDGMDTNGMSGEEGGDRMLKEASALQDKTQDSLNNTKQMIAQSKEVGMATLEELERQRGVIENINNEVLRVDDNLARAEKLVRHRISNHVAVFVFARSTHKPLSELLAQTIWQAHGNGQFHSMFRHGQLSFAAGCSLVCDSQGRETRRRRGRRTQSTHTILARIGHGNNQFGS